MALVACTIVVTVAIAEARAAGGDLDTTFSGDGKATTPFFTVGNPSAAAYAIAQQSDGKVIAAGSATDRPNNDPGPTEFALARFTSGGSLDTSFSGDGKVVTDLFGGIDLATAVAVQPDGKVVAAGTADANAATFLTVFALVRYNTDGSLDTTFGAGGKVGTAMVAGGSSRAEAMVLQPDGKIVVAGSAENAAAASAGFALARYNANGSLDTSFGAGGKVLTPFFGFSDGAADVALQADGKIVAAGHAYPGGANDQFALARYNPDGSLDTGFGVGGKVTTDFFGANDQAHSLVLQQGGKIIAAGLAYPQGLGLDYFALARYNPNGSLDTSFGTGGKATTEFSSAWARSLSAAGQADGKVVAASWGVDGASGFDHFLVARFDANGALDPTFSGDGKLSTSILGSQNQAYATGIQADGRILVAGSAYDLSAAASVFAIARYDGGGATSLGTLSSIAVSPASLVGGSTATGTVQLSAAAPSGGAVISLTDNSTAVTVPSSVTVPAGVTSATFSITTSSVPSTSTATITAVYGGTTLVTGLTLTSATPVAPALASPVNGATVAQPVAFDWGDVSVAADYEIQIDDTSTISAPYRASQVVAASQAAIGGLPAQQLWWRVRARNASGVYGPYSATRSFTPQAAPPGPTVTLSVTATGRSGQRVTSSPAGINVTVGSTQSAGFASNTAITLSVAGGRQAVWSGACSSGGNRRASCTFVITANATVTANVN